MDRQIDNHDSIGLSCRVRVQKSNIPHDVVERIKEVTPSMNYLVMFYVKAKFQLLLIVLSSSIVN